MERKHTPVYGIKGKLISAVCMLLVAMIMVVSSTYAWFTLSTAPEVTGISTAIGANGALEIWLNNTADPADKNATPGNLVDLGEGYGLDKIVLYPSTANFENLGNGKTGINAASLLNYAKYGADGRPQTGVLGGSTVNGTYNTTSESFYQSTDTGIRGIGAASGLTDRQLSYRNALADISTYMTRAKNESAKTLNANGAVLGNMVIKKATGGDSAKYTADEVAALRTIISSLLGTDDTKVDGILDYIEQAYLNEIIALAASKKIDTLVDGSNVTISATAAESLYATVRSRIENGSITLENVTSGISIEVDGKTYTLNLDSALLTGINNFNTTKTNVKSASTALSSITSKTEYSWSDISPVLAYLIKTENVTVNDMEVSAIQADPGSFASSVMGGAGVTIKMNQGSGVFYEIAEQCGNYSATVVIEKIEYNGLTLSNTPIKMATVSALSEPYLTAAKMAVEVAGPPTSSTAGAQLPITEFYGYIIDLGFKTNAASSNLLLQVEGVDRIYDDNSNPDTLGGGSYMVFASTSSDFTTNQVKELMKAIRIVFFTPDEHNTVLGYAKLDVDTAEVGADGVKAMMYMYEIVDAKLYTYNNGTEDIEEVYYVKDGAYYKVTDEGVATTASTVAGDNTALADAIFANTTFERKLSEDDAVITELPQNDEVFVSTLVYLEGDPNKGGVENEDVSATGTLSVTGSMNIQFSSSAELTPMEYGDLHITEEKTFTVTTNGTSATLTSTGAAQASNKSNYTFKLEGADATKNYTVKYKVVDAANASTVLVNETTLTKTADGSYVIPKANIKGNVIITITEVDG